MKKLVVIVLSITALGAISGTAGANNAPGTGSTSPSAEVSTKGSLTSEVINDIAIPTDVLIYVQTQYQGHAVTQASKATRSGQQAYRLRVDKDDRPNDYESFYLLYDMNWKLLGEEKMTPPPAPQPKPAPSNNSIQTSRDDKDKKRPTKPRHER